MNVGTLSGLDVLTVGRVAPGATVELKDGSTGKVLRVRGRRLTRHGILSGGADVRMDDGRELTVSSKQIAGVVREAPRSSAAQSNGSSAAAASDTARPAGV